MIFENVLAAVKRVFRGATEYAILDSREFKEEIETDKSILFTYKQYNIEAHPILYARNRFAFCTSDRYEGPGAFLLFPIEPKYLKFITDIKLYIVNTEPEDQTASRVSISLDAIRNRAQRLQNGATQLKHLSLVIADTGPETDEDVWTLLSHEHPITRSLLRIIKEETVAHLQIRFHELQTKNETTCDLAHHLL